MVSTDSPAAAVVEADAQTPLMVEITPLMPTPVDTPTAVAEKAVEQAAVEHGAAEQAAADSQADEIEEPRRRRRRSSATVTS